MKRKQQNALFFLLLFLTCAFLLCACTQDVSTDLKGIWQTEDGALFLDLNTLRGTLRAQDETEKQIDVLYSASLGNIAFYANEKEEFLGTYELAESVLIIRDAEGMECYRLFPIE